MLTEEMKAASTASVSAVVAGKYPPPISDRPPTAVRPAEHLNVSDHEMTFKQIFKDDMRKKTGTQNTFIKVKHINFVVLIITFTDITVQFAFQIGKRNWKIMIPRERSKKDCVCLLKKGSGNLDNIRSVMIYRQ